MLRRAFVVIAIILVGAGSTSAQGKWWQSERFVKELQLTADQSRLLESVFQASLPALRERKQALDKAETQFALLMERGGDAAIMEQLNHLEHARAELNKARILMLLKMKYALTSTQWAKYTALHDALERERRQSATVSSGK